MTLISSMSDGTLPLNAASSFFVVLARDAKNVPQKIAELNRSGIPFIIVCGEPFSHPNVVYHEANGKWDAVNYAAKFIPKDVQLIIFNDVDTTIHNLDFALVCLSSKADVVYCRVKVSEGPQVMFYRILDPIRQNFHICASGELMLIKKQVFDRVLPIPPCIAEDSYILFKALELGYRAYFCTSAYVTTKRTVNAATEEAYKARTTLGILQALKYTKPSPLVRVFYKSLVLTSPLLAIAGNDGKAWASGIRKAVKADLTKKQVTRF